MRIRWIERFLIALTGLVVFLQGLCMALCVLDILTIETIKESLLFVAPQSLWMWIAMASSILLCIAGCICMHMIIRRKNHARCVIQHSDIGDISITMQALKNMVIKCAQSHANVFVSRVHLYRVRNGIVVEMKITVEGNTNIPATVAILQSQITDYVADCSGVHVKQVRVMVDTSAKDRLRVKDANRPVIGAGETQSCQEEVTSLQTQTVLETVPVMVEETVQEESQEQCFVEEYEVQTEASEQETIVEEEAISECMEPMQEEPVLEEMVQETTNEEETVIPWWENEAPATQEASETEVNEEEETFAFSSDVNHASVIKEEA